ncbi:MAG: lysylphosphatidylglycerol synthase transmembrane domain-containing protein [Ignavibacteriaceae bacterium]
MNSIIDTVKKINTKVGIDKTILAVIAKIVIAAGLIAYLIYHVNLHEIIAAFEKANYRFIILALLLVVVNISLQYYKWKLSCSAILNEKNGKKIFYSLFYGFAAGPFTPVRIGEYFGRALEFKDKSILQVSVATLIDKAFPLIPITLFGSIGSILFLKDYYHVNFYITVSLFVVIFILFYLLIMLVLNPNLWHSFLTKRMEKSKRFYKIFSELLLLKKLDKKFLTKMFFISFLFYSCFIIQYAVLALSFSQNGNFINFLWAGNMVMFAKTIIPGISLGDLGVREGASIFFLSQMGQTSSTGFNTGISLFGINVLLPALVGLILLLKRNNA